MSKNRSKTTVQVVDPPPQLLGPILELYGKGEYAKVETDATALAQKFPNSFLLCSLLGSVSTILEKHAEAERYIRRAIALRPREATAHHNLGVFLHMRGEFDEALEAFDRAISIDAKLALSHLYRGTALYEQSKLDDAISAYDRAIALKPDLVEAHHFRGGILVAKGNDDDAFVAFSEVVRLRSDFAEAHYQLGTILFNKADLTGSLRAFERAAAANPKLMDVTAMKLHVHAHMCDFAANADISVELDVLPWSALTLEDNPERQLQRSQLYWKKGTARAKPLSLPAHARPERTRIRVGYFSSDFHEHATMFLMSGLFREHDKSRFDIFAYSYGTNRDGQYLQLMRRQVTAFRDVQASSDQEIVQFARADDLDIAIDLKGYTSDERSRLFRYRLAPVQINYLGYPGSLGADEIEYIIADPTLITPELRQFYSERVIYLPHSYQPNDNWRVISGRSTTRAQHGLPEGAFVFCCFNHSYKISVREFDIWMRLLGKVPGSVLWLIRTNPHAEQNLRKEAMARGIDPARLVFANKIAIAEHLERHRHADLFLDTFNCNAHTTASDALWAGLPILTKSGRQFAARVGASLLTAVGLPQLIAETEEEYEQKALALALQPRVLNAAKARLAANRSSCPLFDTVRYTRNFEQGLLLAHERYRSGQKPADIFVQDAGDISPARTVQSSVP